MVANRESCGGGGTQLRGGVKTYQSAVGYLVSPARRRLNAVALSSGLTLAALTVVGCGASTEAAPPPSTVTITVPVPTPSASSTPTATTEKSEYPKEVPISSLDERFQYALGVERGQTVAVQLAPGVYAERGSLPSLGDLDDYSAYVGLCSDVIRYAELHPGGYTCY